MSRQERVFPGPQPKLSTDPLSPVVTSLEASSATDIVPLIRLYVSSNSTHPLQPSSQLIDTTLSPEEMAFVEGYRRLRDTSAAVSAIAEPSGPAHNGEPYFPHESSKSPVQSPHSVRPSTSLMPFPSFLQARSPTHVAAFPSLDVHPRCSRPRVTSASFTPSLQRLMCNQLPSDVFLSLI
ncbi:hypothetical protein BDN67DRAFT_967245, partial [Paxillus ammoniavirescens]